MTLFDDLFIAHIVKDFLSYPIFLTIGGGMLLSNVWLCVALSTLVALASELFESTGDIVVQPITASLLVHVTVGITVFFVFRRLR